ncbi:MULTISPECIES: MarR family winged helix-turn-helix transcriptional regulator [Nocardiopsis]|uniref:MarR family transcriptional regulator n=1 Tax=Nocardiopsis sinuspersici TaxID=501010 RepID=A0A1V3C2Y2_9ACTN|nr:MULTISPECIES: MarR family transcriptional regulator [Nocardiopsis]OOC55161.1 MarR family transcriptional regulator [Nocardiopsis sinuspersici]
MDTASTAPSPSGSEGPRPAEPEARSRAELYDALRSDGQRLAVRLIRLLHRMAEHTGMNPTDFQCYTLLRVNGSLTPGEIADSLCLSTGSVTGVIDRLEAHGLVERARHPEDRRKVAVRLTGDAERVGGAGALGVGEAMTAAHAGYSVEELATIADWLDRIGGTLDRLAAEPGR